MRCRVLSGFCIETGRDVLPGEVIDIDPRDAREYLAIGRVEVLVEPGDIETQEPAVINREPRKRR